VAPHERVPIKDIHESKRQTATDPKFLSVVDPEVPIIEQSADPPGTFKIGTV